MQTCTAASYAPAENQNCIRADGGTQCTAKELTITAASLISPAYAPGGSEAPGSPLATAPCCKDPNQQCAQCVAGNTVRGTLRIVMAVNSRQGRYDLGLWSVENGSPSPDQQVLTSTCQKNALEPSQFPPALQDGDCCGDAPNGAAVQADIPNFAIECNAPQVTTTAYCPGSQDLNWCLGW